MGYHVPKQFSFTQGDKVRFIPHRLTRQLGIIGKYGTVLVGRAKTGAVKVMTPTRAGLMPWWFPQNALKSCASVDPRPSVGSIVLFLPCEANKKVKLTDQTGIVIQNMPQSAFCHVETAKLADHCAHFTEIVRIDV